MMTTMLLVLKFISIRKWIQEILNTHIIHIHKIIVFIVYSFQPVWNSDFPHDIIVEVDIPICGANNRRIDLSSLLLKKPRDVID